MKNIHLIKTDKPSKLYEFGGQIILTNELTDAFRNQNIYITSDEEIEIGDWYIDDINQIRKSITENKEYWEVRKNYKKIILTDNQDLIKDGVQSIDDEFLEWFVKNPSCEEVEVIYTNCANCIKIQGQELSPDCCHNYQYKIISSKEKPKQELPKTEIDLSDFPKSTQEHFLKNNPNMGENSNLQIKDMEFNNYIGKEEPKQETLEEVDEIEKIAMDKLKSKWEHLYTFGYPQKPFPTNYENDLNMVKIGLYEGAKWQQERMYSKEEVLQLLFRLKLTESYDNLYNWFQIFKEIKHDNTRADSRTKN